LILFSNKGLFTAVFKVRKHRGLFYLLNTIPTNPVKLNTRAAIYSSTHFRNALK